MTQLERVLSKLPSARKTRTGHEARCPAHEDHRASLSIGVGADGQVLLHCHAGCVLGAILGAIGLELRDLFPAKEREEACGKGKIVETYGYVDETGQLLFQVVRFEPKDFRQRRPDPKNRRGWLWNLTGIRRVLFDLPSVLSAPPEEIIFVVEGEKDVFALRDAGLAATCNPGGAGKWSADYSFHLRGRRVVILPDNDQPGEDHAADVLRHLRGVADSCLIVRLPGLPPKGDASDWLDAGGTREQLLELVAKAEAVNGHDPEPSPTFLIRMSSVKRENVSFLWFPRIPYGKVIDVTGDPGLGKSTLTLEFAARASRGEPLPGDERQRDAHGVVILSAEDGLGDTIRPRLEAAGADLERIVAIQTVPTMDGMDVPQIPRDIPYIRQALDAVQGRLVLIDPLMAFFGSETSSHRDQDVRRALAPLHLLAEETGAAIVVVRHLNKQSTNGNAIYRGGGSIGIVGMVRSALLVARDPDNEERRVLAHYKSNLAKTANAMSFELQDVDGQVSRIRWLGGSTHTASSLLAVPEGGEERSALDEAVDVLREILVTGPKSADDAKREARKAGVSERTLDRAKSRLAVRARKNGFGGGWTWELPESALKTAKSVEERQGRQDCRVETGGDLRLPTNPPPPTAPAEEIL